jgi:large subunit ribosomal protein L10
MKKDQKNQVIDNLAEIINNSNHIYVADTLGMNAANTGDLRRQCYGKNVKLVVAKNTLFKKAIEKSNKDLSGLFEVLSGPSAIMFSEVGNVPAKLIKEFRKSRNIEKPILKGAYVEEGFYIGDNQIETLTTIKSRDELIADVINMLQTPARNIISALQSGGNTITGVLKTLQEKGE